MADLVTDLMLFESLSESDDCAALIVVVIMSKTSLAVSSEVEVDHWLVWPAMKILVELAMKSDILLLGESRGGCERADVT